MLCIVLLLALSLSSHSHCPVQEPPVTWYAPAWLQVAEICAPDALKPALHVAVQDVWGVAVPDEQLPQL